MILLGLCVGRNCCSTDDIFYCFLPMHSCTILSLWHQIFIGRWTHLSHPDVKSAPFKSKWTCRLLKYHQVIIFQDIYAAAESNLVKHEGHKPRQMLHRVWFNTAVRVGWSTSPFITACFEPSELSRAQMHCWNVHVAIRAPFVCLLRQCMLSACKGLELRGWVRAVHGHWD